MLGFFTPLTPPFLVILGCWQLAQLGSGSRAGRQSKRRCCCPRWLLPGRVLRDPKSFTASPAQAEESTGWGVGEVSKWELLSKESLAVLGAGKSH